MNTKKIYSIIAAVFAVTYAYNLFWFFKSLIEFSNYGFQFSFFIRYIPTFAGITGLIIFAASQFKRSNLLRMMMCLEVMSFPFLLFWPDVGLALQPKFAIRFSGMVVYQLCQVGRGISL